MARSLADTSSLVHPRVLPSRVQLDAVSLSIDGRCILTEVSLSLAEARVAIIGSNGSGKSTLARLMAGLLAPDHGTVQVNGIDVCTDRKAAIANVGMVFQNPDHQIIFPTVEEDIAFGPRQLGRSKAEARKMAQDILSRFGVSAWAERPIASLSQGQKHLVCLLAVLVMEPAVLVMDEPFTGLDLKTVRQMTELLSKLDQTIIHVTHDLAAIKGYDRAIWMDGGRIAADGKPDAIIREYIRASKSSEVSHAVTHLAS